MSQLLSTKPAVWNIGLDPRNSGDVFLNEVQLSRHMAVFGGSGSGKSKFLELLCRRMIDDYRGFCFIDPHGDTVEDLLSHCHQRIGKTGTDAICKRIHYLEPTFETVFGFDPFRFRPPAGISPQHIETAYEAWLHAKVRQVAEVVQRKQGQGGFQGMPQLERILTDVLTAVGRALDSSGKHLPLSDILVFLDAHHPEHNRVMQLVLPKLPAEIRADFASMKAYRTEDQRKREIGSTINRLRSLLSPIMKAIFRATTDAIDVRNIIANRGIILVNLRKTDFFSADQRNAIGGLLINEILSAVECVPREKRMPYYLIIDEARLFIGEDLMEALDQARKFQLSVCLAGQFLGQFRTEEFDMTPSILENCGTVMCFQQKHPDNLKLWKEYFGYPNLSFEKHFQMVDRHRGYDFESILDWSISESQGSSRNTGASWEFGSGTSQTNNWSQSQGMGVNESQSSQRSSGRTNASSRSEASGYSSGQSRPAIIIGGHSIGSSVTPTEHRNRNSSNQASSSSTEGNSAGESSGVSFEESQSHGVADGHSTSESRGYNLGFGHNYNRGFTVSHKTVPMARIEEEVQRSAQLEDSIDDQFHKFAQIQRMLPERHAMVSARGVPQSFVIRIADVDPCYGKTELPKKLAEMKQKIYATHSYYSTPKLSPAQQEQRLKEFLDSINRENSREEPEPQPKRSEKERDPFISDET